LLHSRCIAVAAKTTKKRKETVGNQVINVIKLFQNARDWPRDKAKNKLQLWLKEKSQIKSNQ